MDLEPKYIVMMILCGLCCLMGFVAVLVGLRNVQRALASKEWPQVYGRITESKSVYANEVYSPEIRYAYVVNGQEFTGSKITYGDFYSSNPSRTQRMLSRYSLNSSVAVSFNPKKPHESVLEPGAWSRALFPVFVGIAFVIFGALFLWSVATIKPLPPCTP
jgi:hypothetical protein